MSKKKKKKGKKQKQPREVKKQKTQRSNLTYLRGHLAFTSECRDVEFCGRKKKDYKSARRDLNQVQKDQRERESWQQPLIFTRLEKHVGRTGSGQQLRLSSQEASKTRGGIFSVGVEREVLQMQSSGASVAVESASAASVGREVQHQWWP